MNPYLPTEMPGLKITIESEPEAQLLASFPVKMPDTLPQQFQLESSNQWWPEHIDEDGRAQKVHADFLLTTFADPDGHHLIVIQGFTGAYFYLTMLAPPAEVSGVVQIGNRSARWLSGRPADNAGLHVVDGKQVPDKWVSGDFSYVGWQDGTHPPPLGGHGDSPRYFGLASDVLDVDELVSIAKTVPETPFVTTP